MAQKGGGGNPGAIANKGGGGRSGGSKSGGKNK